MQQFTRKRLINRLISQNIPSIRETEGGEGPKEAEIARESPPKRSEPFRRHKISENPGKGNTWGRKQLTETSKSEFPLLVKESQRGLGRNRNSLISMKTATATATGKEEHNAQAAPEKKMSYNSSSMHLNIPPGELYTRPLVYLKGKPRSRSPNILKRELPKSELSKTQLYVPKTKGKFSEVIIPEKKGRPLEQDKSPGKAPNMQRVPSHVINISSKERAQRKLNTQSQIPKGGTDFDLEQALTIGKYMGGGAVALRKYSTSYMRKIRQLMAPLNTRNFTDVLELTSMEEDMNYGREGDGQHSIISHYMQHLDKRLGLINKKASYARVIDKLNQSQSDKRRYLRFTKQYLNIAQGGKSPSQGVIRRGSVGDMPTVVESRTPEGFFDSDSESPFTLARGIPTPLTKGVEAMKAELSFSSVAAEKGKGGSARREGGNQGGNLRISMFGPEVSPQKIYSIPRLKRLSPLLYRTNSTSATDTSNNITSELSTNDSLSIKPLGLDLLSASPRLEPQTTQVESQKGNKGGNRTPDEGSRLKRADSYYPNTHRRLSSLCIGDPANADVFQRLNTCRTKNRSKSVIPNLSHRPSRTYSKYTKRRSQLLKNYNKMMNDQRDDSYDTHKQEEGLNLRPTQQNILSVTQLTEMISHNQQSDKLPPTICSPHFSNPETSCKKKRTNSGSESARVDNIERKRTIPIVSKKTNKEDLSKVKAYNIETKRLCGKKEMNKYHNFLHDALNKFSDPFLKEKYDIYLRSQTAATDPPEDPKASNEEPIKEKVDCSENNGLQIIDIKH